MVSLNFYKDRQIINKSYVPPVILYVFSFQRQGMNIFYRLRFIFMHLFSPRHNSNKFGSALGLSKTFIGMHLFSPRHSPNKFGSALGLSKTF